MEEVENVYPYLYKRFLYKKERQEVARLRQLANEVCRNQISHEYIHQQMNRFDKGLVYKNEEGETIGFCIWKEYSKQLQKDGTYEAPHLYITLICGIKQSYPITPIIFYDLESYCIKNGMDIIELKAVNEQVKNYYMRLGFQESIKLNELYKKIELIQIPRVSGKTRKRHSTQRLQNHTPQRNIENTIQIVNAQEYERHSVSRKF